MLAFRHVVDKLIVVLHVKPTDPCGMSCTVSVEDRGKRGSYMDNRGKSSQGARLQYRLSDPAVA